MNTAIKISKIYIYKKTVLTFGIKAKFEFRELCIIQPSLVCNVRRFLFNLCSLLSLKYRVTNNRCMTRSICKMSNAYTATPLSCLVTSLLLLLEVIIRRVHK